MTYTETSIKVSDIYLDQENPRFPPVQSQREAISAMLKDQGEKIFRLALDIYQNGLNPSSKLIVFKTDNKLVDGDGNRRLTAIKILETPSLADDFPKIRKKFDSILRQAGTIPAKVECVVFDNRDAARHWISINHGGEQDGRGQITWNSEQKDRFEQKLSIGLEALDLLLHKGLITDNDKSQVNKSTLDRLLAYKAVKSLLSISKNGGVFYFGNEDLLRKVILGLKGMAVDEVYTAAKGCAFVQKVIDASETSNPCVRDNSGTNSGNSSNERISQGIRSPRTKKPIPSIFGKKLSLNTGRVNNLYRDIESLYNFYQAEKNRLSEDFIVIVRMSLRMLAESAAKDAQDAHLRNYLTKNFEEAKKSLDQNTRTTLSNQNVTKDSIVKLFQTGAHDYDNSRNEEQALAMSIILGAILTITHGKQP